MNLFRDKHRDACYFLNKIWHFVSFDKFQEVLGEIVKIHCAILALA